MQNTILKNVTIFKKKDQNSNTYYLIIDNDKKEDNAYFCFEGAIREGWKDLIDNWENIKEIEIDYEVNERNNNKVINLYIPKEDIFV